MKAILAAIFLCLSDACLAQDSASLQGKWIGKYSLPGGNFREIKIEILGSGGTWQILATSASNACLGKKAAIELADVSQDGFKMLVQNSKTLAGCPDFEYAFIRKSSTEYSSQLKDGTPLSLTRE